MAAKTSVLGLILSSNPYLRSAMVRFPFVISNKLNLPFAKFTLEGTYMKSPIIMNKIDLVSNRLGLVMLAYLKAPCEVFGVVV